MSENKAKMHFEEKIINPISGWATLLFTILLIIACLVAIGSSIGTEQGAFAGIGIIILVFFVPFLFKGLTIIKPNEAKVLVLFGKYHGSIKKDGFFFINPFCTSVNPAKGSISPATTGEFSISLGLNSPNISLKAMTLNNNRQKVNDELGNPIEIGIIVIWKINNTAKAVFNVENYKVFLSIQADSALRDVARLYPYDVFDDNEDGNEKTLRGSSQEVAVKLKEELQKRVDMAGLEIMEARITHLAYSQEIAAAMLQRQQAAAIIAARQKIVEGAVGMVEMALNSLNEKDVCNLDDDKKATMVSNLLVVLCGNKDAQPIVNSGSLQ